MPQSHPTFRATVTLFALVFAFTSCSLVESEDPVPTSIDISPANPNLNAIDATQQLSATVRDQDNNTISGASITWSDGGTGVATVNSSGLVTAVANGSETITASSGGLNTTTTVTVQQIPAAFTKPEGDAQTAPVGEALPTALVAQINDAQGNPIEGVDLEFAVTSGGGTVATASGTTVADGRLSTTWTLGTMAGAQEVTVSVANDDVSATFGATAEPGPAVAIEKASGDNQSGLIDAPLANPLVVRALDEFDNGVPDVAIEFATSDGSVNPTAAMTNADGEAQTTWTLGSTEGGQTVTATSDELTGSPLTFNAAGGTLALTAVAPDPIVEGQTATITGTGFDLTAANNAVMVGGVAATVTSAAATELQVTVPAFNCQPARNVDVTVTVSGFTSNAINQALNPAAFVSLAAGQQQILQTPANYCLQFPATAANEHYLIGVQSTSDVFSTLTPITLTSVTGGGPMPPTLAAAQERRSRAGSFVPMMSERARRLAAHREAESEIQEFSRRMWEQLARTPSAAPEPSAMVVPGTVEIGDQVMVNVINADATTCQNSFTTITTTVKAKSATSIWLNDNANPSNGYTDQDFLDLADALDNDIYPADVAQFGEPTDADDNDRIVIVVTKEVNERGATLLGFVISCDIPSGATAGNGGEFFYGKAPDPANTHGSTYTREAAVEDAPFLIAHEFTHIIQQTRRHQASAQNFMVSWMAEGQATLAEEVVGHAVEGRAEGTNLGFMVATNSDDPSSTDWYSNAFGDMAQYFGFNGSGQPQIPTAPHQCTWLAATDDGCNGGRKIYGVPWSLLRYISDRFGNTYPGGAPGLHQDMIDATNNGFDTMEEILTTAGGPSFATVLAQWSAMLYVDDLVGAAPPELTMSSWDLDDIFSNFNPGAQLIPNDLTYTDFSNAVNVRAGSTYYTLIQGGTRPATAIRARNGTDGTLPSHMQYWVVRIQ